MPPPIATADEVKAAVDAIVATEWDGWVAQQEAYKATNGVYWSGPVSHTSRPSGGVETVPDNVDAARPGFETWRSLRIILKWQGNNPKSSLVRYRVDPYESPLGDGWRGFAEFDDPENAAVMWRRIKAAGPDASGQSAPWAAFEAAEVP